MAAPKPGGFKISLGSLKSKPGHRGPATEKDTKKRRLVLGDDEPEDDNKHQEIVGWDAAEGGALDVGGKKEEGPRIIPLQSTRDWRTEARRKQLAKAPHTKEQDANMPVVEIEEPRIQYGLTFLEKKEEEKEEQSNGTTEAAPEPMEVDKDDLTEEQRLEKKALAALMTGKSTDNDLVIPALTEDQALRNDLENAPDAPTLEAYQAQPIEGFGAALLRGMGWKDGEGVGKNGAVTSTKVKRRPALLGIGAKEEAAVGVELGEWSSKAKGKKVAQTYNPVALRNKKTGEIITEEELNAKLETQNLIQDEKPVKSRSKYRDEEDEDSGRRHERRRDDKDRDRDRDRRREDDYNSERRRDKDRSRRDRDRDRDECYDSSDRRRDKRKDKESDYDSTRRRDKRRERSRSPDDRRERKRDRYRSRSRDAEDRRERRKERDRRERSRSREVDDRRKRH